MSEAGSEASSSYHSAAEDQSASGGSSSSIKGLAVAEPLRDHALGGCSRGGDAEPASQQQQEQGQQQQQQQQHGQPRPSAAEQGLAQESMSLAGFGDTAEACGSGEAREGVAGFLPGPGLLDYPTRQLAIPLTQVGSRFSALHCPCPRCHLINVPTCFLEALPGG